MYLPTKYIKGNCYGLAAICHKEGKEGANC